MLCNKLQRNAAASKCRDNAADTLLVYAEFRVTILQVICSLRLGTAVDVGVDLLPVEKGCHSHGMLEFLFFPQFRSLPEGGTLRTR